MLTATAIILFLFTGIYGGLINRQDGGSFWRGFFSGMGLWLVLIGIIGLCFLLYYFCGRLHLP